MGVLKFGGFVFKKFIDIVSLVIFSLFININSFIIITIELYTPSMDFVYYMLN